MRLEQATLDHGKLIAPRIRFRDVYGMSKMELVDLLLKSSVSAHVILNGNTPVCLFGITARSFFSHRASLWGLVSDEVSESPISFGRISKKIIKNYMDQYNELEASAYKDHELGDRWVRWLGFVEVPSAEPGMRMYLQEKH